MSKPKMICPDCGAEMNREVDYGIEDAKFIDAVFGGALKEAHTCPECGRTELRPA